MHDMVRSLRPATRRRSMWAGAWRLIRRHAPLNAALLAFAAGWALILALLVTGWAGPVAP
jgi:protein-S-isoprenylcysteine O-methyltransferase Ste14